MPRSALPEHLDTAEEWKKTDWDNPFQHWLLKYKHWLAFGPRATEWWARWREFPVILFARKGKGQWRFENSNGSLMGYADWAGYGHHLSNLNKEEMYLSCIQYWCQWSVQLQWPLFFSFHIYFKEASTFPNKPIDDHRMIYFRIGARRDADKIYWFPSFFLGLTFN